MNCSIKRSFACIFFFSNTFFCESSVFFRESPQYRILNYTLDTLYFVRSVLWQFYHHLLFFLRWSMILSFSAKSERLSSSQTVSPFYSSPLLSSPPPSTPFFNPTIPPLLSSILPSLHSFLQSYHPSTPFIHPPFFTFSFKSLLFITKIFSKIYLILFV